MKLVELPIDPKFGAAILNSNKEEYKWTEEILTIASVLSVNSIFQTNIDPVRISKTKKKLGAVEGDHITLVNIFNTSYSNNIPPITPSKGSK